MFATTLDSAARIIIIAALVSSAIVAATHWTVRRRTLSPFGAWPRLVRRISDPVLRPFERRIMRAGGNPQDAPLWLFLAVLIGGLLVLTSLKWATGFAQGLVALADASPRDWLRTTIGLAVDLLMGALLVRVVASWVGISAYARWMRPVAWLTDWLLDPIRRRLPATGPIDFSPMVAWLVLWLVRVLLLSVV